MSKTKLEIQLMAIDKITPYDKNAKIRSETQVKSLADVIKSQGWDVPIVVDRHGVIIKGHGRRLAAMYLGLTEVPVIVRSDLTDAQVKAARLSDNRVAMGDFDVNAIKDELSALKIEGFDLTTTGFGDKELEMMLGSLDQIDMTAFDTPDFATSAPQSSATAHPADTTTPDAPKSKTLLVTDLLGFKSIPAEYRDDLIAFMAMYKFEETDPAVVFGKLIRMVLKETP